MYWSVFSPYAAWHTGSMPSRTIGPPPEAWATAPAIIELSPDEAIGKDVLCLAYTVRTVYGLLLYCGVPPWVYYIYIIGSGKVKAYTTCLKRNKEYSAFMVVLELL